MKVQFSNIEQKLINQILEERKQNAKQLIKKAKASAQDVFEYSCAPYKKGGRKVVEMSPDGEYIVNGRIMRDVGYKGGPRELPNSVTGPHDYAGFKSAGKVEFYPEDIEKMKHMSDNKCLEYMSKLIEQNRFVGGEKYIK